MAGTKYAKDAVIRQEGDRDTQLCIIASGSVKANNPFSEIILGKGEVLGICENDNIYYPFDYKALEDTVLYIYTYTSPSDIASLIAENPGAAGMMTNSFANKCCSFLEVYTGLLQDCQNLYDSASNLYDKYQDLCKIYQVEPLSLPGLSQLSEFTIDSCMDEWIIKYYEELGAISTAGWKQFYDGRANACAGFIMKTSADLMYIFPFCERLHRYLDMINDLFLSDFNLDLFTFYLSLFQSVEQLENADLTSLQNIIDSMILEINNETRIDKELIESRMAEYKDIMGARASQKASKTAQLNSEVLKKAQEELPNSIDQITGYAGIPEVDARRFRNLVQKFIGLADRNSADDQVRELRKELTVLFYDTYRAAFFNSLSTGSIPTVIKMFFYFGYVDETLIGMEQALYLYVLADKIAPDPNQTVFTLYDWLTEIYHGRKDPCINDLNIDYTAYLHNLKVTGKLTQEQEAAALRNKEQRVNFEFDNMFRLTNKVTFGRITTFCPLLSDHNLYKQLDSAYISPAAIHEALKQIRSVDYSAYYRETIFTAPEKGITKELVQAEVLPDIILMPNIGSRGVMWQEITGRKRNSPARMMISIFSTEELYPTMVRLTGEFRWELCRRIQGVRWNDISERSLTSDYCDYLQTYKKNRDLSPEAKEKMKLALQKARNSSKEMFVRDYIDYVTFEGVGSIRMNKLARYILFNYCPFSKAIREAMVINPLYKEIIERYQNKNKQALHLNDMVMQKLANNKIEVPEEMKAHRMFLQM